MRLESVRSINHQSLFIQLINQVYFIKCRNKINMFKKSGFKMVFLGDVFGVEFFF